MEPPQSTRNIDDPSGAVGLIESPSCDTPAAYSKSDVSANSGVCSQSIDTKQAGPPMNIVVMGSTGCGKSTLINSLYSLCSRTLKRPGVTSGTLDSKVMTQIHGQDFCLIDTPGFCDTRGDDKFLDDLDSVLSVVFTVAVADACVDVGAKVAQTLIERVHRLDRDGKFINVMLCGTKVDLANDDDKKRFTNDVDGCPSVKSQFFSKLPNQTGTCVMVGKDNYSELLEAIRTIVTQEKEHRKRTPLRRLRLAYPSAYTKIMDTMHESVALIGGEIEESKDHIADELHNRAIQELVLEEYRCIWDAAEKKRNASSPTSSGNLLKDLQDTIALTARKLFDSSKSASDEVKCREVKSFIDEVLEKFNRLRRIVLAIKKIPADLIQSNKTKLCNSKRPELLNLTKALALHEEMKSSDWSQNAIQELIEGALNQEYLDPEGQRLRPLHRAVELESPKLVKLLCQFGADLIQEPSPIQYAQQLGQRSERAFEALAEFPQCFRAADIMPESIKNLTKAKADINFADELQRTALHHHAMASHVEVVKSLVLNKASVDKEDSERNTPFDLAKKVGACQELMKALDHVILFIGLSGQTLAVRTSLFLEERDFVAFLREHVREYYIKEKDTRVSHFTIGIAVVGQGVAETRKSWEARGRPSKLQVTMGCNFRDDPEKSRDFLRSSERIGSDLDLLIQGHLEDFQDPDVADQRGETAAWKAARNNDVSKLKLLDMACANFDMQDQSGATALFIASQHGHVKAIRFLVEHKATVDLPLQTKATPLYVACQNGHKDIADFLLKSGADPDFQTIDLATSTFIAAQMGHFEIVKMLLEAKADKDKTNVTNASPLFIAAQNDHKEIVQCLLDKQASIDEPTESGASPTYIAAQKGSMQALQLLLDSQADANLQANDGATPILIAAQNDKQDAVRLLLKYGASSRKAMKSGATPLFVAAQNGYLQVVKDLLRADKLVNICLHNGTSALYVAAQNGHLDVVKRLYEEKADINLKSSGNASPLFIAAQNGHLSVCCFILDLERQRLREKKECQLMERTDDASGPLLVAAQNGHLPVVAALTEELQAFFSPEKVCEFINEAKKGGATALYLSSQNGHPDVVSYLLQFGASVRKALETEETPMFIACQGGHQRVMEFLLEAQANINKGKRDKTTPLYIAAQNGHTSLIEPLLDAKANPNLQNDSMATALFISSQKGHIDIVSTLLSRNADHGLSIKSKAQPLYIAAAKGHSQVVAKLIDFGADVNASPLHKTTPLQIAIRNGHTEVNGVADRLLDAKADVNRADQFGTTCLEEAMKKTEADKGLVQKLFGCGAELKGRTIFNQGIPLLRTLPEDVVSIVRKEVMPTASEGSVHGYPGGGHKLAGDQEVYGGLEIIRTALEHGNTLVLKLGTTCTRLRQLIDGMAGEVLLNKEGMQEFLDSLSKVQTVTSECGLLVQEMYDEASTSSLKLSALLSPLFDLIKETIQQCSKDLSGLSVDLENKIDLSQKYDFRNELVRIWFNLTDISSLTTVSNELFNNALLLLKKSRKEVGKRFGEQDWKSVWEKLQQCIMEVISDQAFVLFKSEGSLETEGTCQADIPSVPKCADPPPKCDGKAHAGGPQGST